MSNRLTELLGIEKPVIAAAMNYVSNAELMAAVSNAGGMGVIGINANVDVPTRDPIETRENYRKEIHKIRTLTDKPFGVNYVVMGTETKDFATSYSALNRKMLIEEKVPAVLFCSTMHVYEEQVAKDIKEFKEAGITVIYRDLDCTVEACVKAVKYGADAIIATGTEAGGHASMYKMTTITIVPLVTNALPDVPVIAAGGITEIKSAKAAAAMGADGVYVGTAFTVARECRAHANYKQAIFKAKGTDIIEQAGSNGGTHLNVVNNWLGRTGRALSNGGVSASDMGRHYAGGFQKSLIEGDVDTGILTVNPGIDFLTEERPAADIVNELAAAFA